MTATTEIVEPDLNMLTGLCDEAARHATEFARKRLRTIELIDEMIVHLTIQKTLLQKVDELEPLRSDDPRQNDGVKS